MSYNRYKLIKGEGKVRVFPSIRLTQKSTDYFEEYKRGHSRLDNISYKYYNDPNYDWLIMLANPEYGSMEFEIPDETMLRIPYPLELSLEDYETQIGKYNTLYGL